MGGLRFGLGAGVQFRAGLRSGQRTASELGLSGPRGRIGARRTIPFQERVLLWEVLFGSVENRVGFGGLPRCRALGTDAVRRLLWVLLLRFVTC